MSLDLFQCSFEPRSVVSGSARVGVCGVPRSASRAAAVKPRASVPVISSGYPAGRTPSPHTVSAPRERSRIFTLQIPIAILVISRVFTRVNGFSINCVVLVIFASSRGNIFTRTLLLRRGNLEGFPDLSAVGTPVPSGRLDEA
ncbi:hypothetical protein EVAR_22170_1 [Eumeta japonica]|uniref:Uncharacterized protein n=1 Tax=Eumeta variegata TaxID=151549 RepID=A0A4C1XZN5_EUMVA|nr:hypothetical protein EVAR_22170_1 [Eumeta japonica]